MLALVCWLKGFCNRIKLQWGEKRSNWRRLESSRSQHRAFGVCAANWEWKTTACQPNSSCSWFSESYWDTAISIQSTLVYSCFQMTVAELNNCYRYYMQGFRKRLVCIFVKAWEPTLLHRQFSQWKHQPFGTKTLLPSPQHQERIINAKVVTSPLVNT